MECENKLDCAFDTSGVQLKTYSGQHSDLRSRTISGRELGRPWKRRRTSWIVVSIYAQKAPLTVSLVESDQRKVGVFAHRHSRAIVAKCIDPDRSYRKCTPTSRKLCFCSGACTIVGPSFDGPKAHAPDGTAIFLKGRSWKAECDEARKEWRFDVTSFPSKTDPDAAILKITGVSHA